MIHCNAKHPSVNAFFGRFIFGKLKKWRQSIMNKNKKRLGILLLITGILIVCLPLASAENRTEGFNYPNQTPTMTADSAPRFITIDPIGNHTIGSIFFINGTTNLPVTESQKVQLIIYPESSFTFGLHYVKELEIFPGSNGVNLWSDNVTDLDWARNKESLFEAIVLSQNTPANETQGFTMQEANPYTSISPTLTRSSFKTISTGQSSRPSTSATAGQAAPVPVIFSVFAIIAGIVFYSTFHDKIKR
jgi:hypothetical protein